MADQHTPGSDEGRAGLSASSDDPMSRVHAHARTHEANPLDGPANPHSAGEAIPVYGDAALAWLAGYDPDDGKGGPIGETDGSEEFTRDVVLAAFEAGAARAPIVGLALSLVQDIDELIGNSEGVAGLHMNGDVAPWSSLTEGGEFGSWLGSFDRLRDHLDVLFPVNANPVKIMDTEGAQYEQTAAGDLVAFGARPGRDDEPVLTIVVNGTEYRTTSTSVRGKLGGCPIRAEWDCATSLRIHIDTPGYVPPPAPPIIYGRQPGPGVYSVDQGLPAGMDPEVVDALRQTHDGA